MSKTPARDALKVTPIRVVLQPEIMQDLQAEEIQEIVAILQSLIPQGGRPMRVDNQP